MMGSGTMVKEKQTVVAGFQSGRLFEAWLARREITLGGFDAAKFSGPSSLSSWLSARA